MEVVSFAPSVVMGVKRESAAGPTALTEGFEGPCACRGEFAQPSAPFLRSPVDTFTEQVL